MNKILGVSALLITNLLMVQPVMAQTLQTAEASALPSYALQNEDVRVTQLKAFLETYDSPLAESAKHFIAEADRLRLDWRLVAAIAGVESTFGKHIPTHSFNGWGWGVFTGASDGVHFMSWNDGITIVSEGLRYRYIDKGATSIEQIGRIYAASPVWSQKVKYFIEKIESFTPLRVNHLAVTI